MFARKASITAVKGSALMNGCIKPGNFCEEKNTPDAIHIGIITTFMRPEAASIVFAREESKSPKAQKENEPKTHRAVRSSSEPRMGTWKIRAPNRSEEHTSELQSQSN